MTDCRIEIPAQLDNLGLVRDFVTAITESAHFSPDRAGELLLAIDEAVSNIIMHGFKSAGDGRIELIAVEQPDQLRVSIRDDAPLYDPTQNQMPDLDMSPMDRDQAGGFGVFLLNQLADSISYRVTEDGRNELSIAKNKG